MSQRTIIKCDNCGQQNRVSDSAQAALCGRCKRPLNLVRLADENEQASWGEAMRRAAAVAKVMPTIAPPTNDEAGRESEAIQLLNAIAEIVKSVALDEMTSELNEIATRLTLAGYIDPNDDDDGDDPDGDDDV